MSSVVDRRKQVQSLLATILAKLTPLLLLLLPSLAGLLCLMGSETKGTST